MNRTLSPHPSPPVGERVSAGRVRGNPNGSWAECRFERNRTLPRNQPSLLPLPGGELDLDATNRAPFLGSVGGGFMDAVAMSEDVFQRRGGTRPYQFMCPSASEKPQSFP